MDNLGNLLNRIVHSGRSRLFEQGELAELTYGALEITIGTLDKSPKETIEFAFPVGWRPDNQPISGHRSYQKAELRDRYMFLAHRQLALNGLVQIVTITEATLTDVIRAVVRKHPQKLGSKRTVPLQMVLEAASIEDVHIKATDSYVNELAYKSPAEYAEAVERQLSVNLNDSSAFHKYIEVKATRDIHMHNGGIANDVYVRKASSHALSGLVSSFQLKSTISCSHMRFAFN